jgi:DNA-directed RNA polymerase specialized sigma24 family protein
MNNSGDSYSEEVGAGRSRESRQAAECMEKCLKVLPDEQRESILKYYGDENQLPPDLAISILQLKTGTRRLRECLEKCLQEASENSLPL